MEIFPAIDLRNGNAVRLMKGDYDQMTVYSDSPASVAAEFKAAGARNIHMVDLDGAKDASLANFATVEKVIRETGLFVEIGGGIRTEEAIDKYLTAGAGRVILGTIAIKNYAFVEEMVKKYGDKIAVGVDTKNGYIATNGWLETSEINGVDFVKRLRDTGVKTVICTDIAKDGMMQGTNMDLYRTLHEIKGIDVVASGGISTIDEVKALKDICYGAILGKSLYIGAIDLKEALIAGEGLK